MGRDEALDRADVDKDAHLRGGDQGMSVSGTSSEGGESDCAHLVDARDDAVDDLSSEWPVDDGAVLEREDGLAVLHDAPSPRAVLGLLVDDGDDVAEPTRARPFDLSPQLVRQVAAQRLVEVGRVHDEVLREQFLRV